MRLIQIIFFLIFMNQYLSAQGLPKIGVSVPLTGMAATYGQALSNGVKLYTATNPSLLKRVQIIFDDHAYEGSKTVSSIRKLSAVDQVEFLLVWGITPSTVAISLSKSVKTPMLLITTEEQVGNNPDIAYITISLAKFRDSVINLIAKKSYKSVAFIGSNIGDVVNLQRMLKDAGQKFIFEEIVSNENVDFNLTISKLKKLNVDSLILVLNPEQMLPFAKQAKSQNFKAEVISGDLLANDQTRTIVKDSIGKVTYIYGFVEPDFLNKYKSRYNTTNNIFEAGIGYTFAAMVDEIYSKSSSKFRIHDLLKLKVNNSAVGAIKFESNTSKGLISSVPLVEYEN